MKDTSKALEVEKFRKSSNETSFTLDNSDDLIPCEQSVIASEPEALSCSEKSPEAVLWKLYEKKMNHDSIVIPDDLPLNNIQVENIEPNSLVNRENNYVLGNLNFNAFLNELKKLTKNGSFQKVLHIFGKRQKEINGTNGCNQLDLQSMLQMITECVCVVAALNAESSHDEQMDKCCSTDDIELYTDFNIELNKLKNQLSAASQKYDIDLKAYKSELQALKQEKIKLENKYQVININYYNIQQNV